MLAKYEDIRDRIKEEPTWFDSNGTPRYGKFHPDLSPNIYAEEAALVKIQCQNCHKEFLVEFNWCQASLIWNENSKPLSYWIKKKTIHYGDPPRHLGGYGDDRGCVGETMNCDDIKVVQFWKQNPKKLWRWERIKELEIMLVNKIGGNVNGN